MNIIVHQFVQIKLHLLLLLIIILLFLHTTVMELTGVYYGHYYSEI